MTQAGGPVFTQLAVAAAAVPDTSALWGHVCHQEYLASEAPCPLESGQG